MKIFLIIISICTSHAFKTTCDEVKLHGVSHNAEVLRDNLDRPNRLAVEKITNTLYFGYDHGVYNNVSKHGRINLQHRGFSEIFVGFDNHAYGLTIDEVNHEIYLGRSDGIYKYDYNNDKAEIINSNIRQIWSMYYKDVLYLVIFKDKDRLHTYSQGQERVVQSFDNSALYLVIDSHDVVYFSNTFGIYKQKKGTNEAVYTFKVFDKPTTYIVRAFAVDNYDQVYVCLNDGIYYIHKDTTTLEKVLDVNEAFGITFDNENNLIYSDQKKLVRLTKCSNDQEKRNNQPVNIVYHYHVHNHLANEGKNNVDSQFDYIDKTATN